MNRFAGKYSFQIDNRKLVFWEYRAGLIGKDRTTIRKSVGSQAYVPLPPEACQFIALDQGDGSFLLQAWNGEILSFNDYPPLLISSSVPTGNKRYYVPTTRAHFDLAEFRLQLASGLARLKFNVESAPGTQRILSFNTKGQREVDLYEGPELTNLVGNTSTASWSVTTHADGVAALQASKKVVHFNFARMGQAVVDVSGEDLSGVDFGHTDLTGARLVGTNLGGSKHARSVLRDTVLDRAVLDGATLQGVDLVGSRVDRTSLNALKGGACDFSGCDLRTVIVSTPLALSSSETAPMRFSRAQVPYPVLGGNWSTMKLDRASILDIPAGIELDARKADLSGVHLQGLSLASGAKFDNAILRGATLVEASIPFGSFASAILDGTLAPELAATDFAGARLQGCNFQDARCSGVNFSGARMDEVKFDKASLRGANFTNAYLSGVSFAGVEQKRMTGVSFNRAFLVDSNFTGTDLSSSDGSVVNLTQAYLHGADFTDCKLAGTLMGAAGLSFGPGSLAVKIGGFEFTKEYDATLIDPEDVTTAETTCPSGAKGPCSIAQMHSRSTFPTIWPWPLGRDLGTEAFAD